MAENSFVGEDWECECYDLAPCDHLVTPSRLSAPRPLEYKTNVSVERDDVSECEQLSLSTDVSAATDAKSTYVTDNKKVFVSNINYRVCSSVSCLEFIDQWLSACFGSQSTRHMVSLSQRFFCVELTVMFSGSCDELTVLF